MSEKIDSLRQIINEGNIISEFTKTEAWEIIGRTLRAILSNYESDCFDASRRTDRDIRGYLGRVEAIREVIELIEHRFNDSSKKAFEELNILEQMTEEELELNRSITNTVNTIGYLGERPGLQS